MRLDDFPRISLAHLPTPLEEAPRLAEAIGLRRLFIKRDDNTGLALGGNKARKLEFLMAEARGRGADIILSCGGPQSNHVRMTAAAANKLGMDCMLFVPVEYTPEGSRGNLLMDVILGAEIRFLPGVSFQGVSSAMELEEKRLIEEGRVPYVIPFGGSTPLGAMGYVNAVRELSQQMRTEGEESADIIVAVGTCGTLAGLATGCSAYMPEARIVGISVLWPSNRIRKKVEWLAEGIRALIETEPGDCYSKPRVYERFVGEGYGIPTEECKEAILLSARMEGLILDPVYTGKAMAGLIDLARKRRIGQDRPVVFWHTGGAPALFAYEKLFE